MASRVPAPSVETLLQFDAAMQSEDEERARLWRRQMVDAAAAEAIEAAAAAPRRAAVEPAMAATRPWPRHAHGWFNR